MSSRSTSLGVGLLDRHRGGPIATVDDRGALRVGPNRRFDARSGLLRTRRRERDRDRRDGRLRSFRPQPDGLRAIEDGDRLARAAVGRLAEKFPPSLEETAQAILDIAVSEMFVVRWRSSPPSAGVDLRDFTLMPFRR